MDIHVFDPELDSLWLRDQEGRDGIIKLGSWQCEIDFSIKFGWGYGTLDSHRKRSKSSKDSFSITNFLLKHGNFDSFLTTQSYFDKVESSFYQEIQYPTPRINGSYILQPLIDLIEQERPDLAYRLISPSRWWTVYRTQSTYTRRYPFGEANWVPPKQGFSIDAYGTSQDLLYVKKNDVLSLRDLSNIPPTGRSHNDYRLIIDNQVGYRFDEFSELPPSDKVIVPTIGTGRWILNYQYKGKGFSFLAQDINKLYIKRSSIPGDWEITTYHPALEFQGTYPSFIEKSTFSTKFHNFRYTFDWGISFDENLLLDQYKEVWKYFYNTSTSYNKFATLENLEQFASGKYRQEDNIFFDSDSVVEMCGRLDSRQDYKPVMLDAVQGTESRFAIKFGPILDVWEGDILEDDQPLPLTGIGLLSAYDHDSVSATYKEMPDLGTFQNLGLSFYSEDLNLVKGIFFCESNALDIKNGEIQVGVVSQIDRTSYGTTSTQETLYTFTKSGVFIDGESSNYNLRVIKRENFNPTLYPGVIVPQNANLIFLFTCNSIKLALDTIFLRFSFTNHEDVIEGFVWHAHKQYTPFLHITEAYTSDGHKEILNSVDFNDAFYENPILRRSYSTLTMDPENFLDVAVLASTTRTFSCLLRLMSNNARDCIYSLQNLNIAFNMAHLDCPTKIQGDPGDMVCKLTPYYNSDIGEFSDTLYSAENLPAGCNLKVRAKMEDGWKLVFSSDGDYNHSPIPKDSEGFFLDDSRPENLAIEIGGVSFREVNPLMVSSLSIYVADLVDNSYLFYSNYAVAIGISENVQPATLTYKNYTLGTKITDYSLTSLTSGSHPLGFGPCSAFKFYVSEDMVGLEIYYLEFATFLSGIEILLILPNGLQSWYTTRDSSRAVSHRLIVPGWYHILVAYKGSANSRYAFQLVKY